MCLYGFKSTLMLLHTSSRSLLLAKFMSALTGVTIQMVPLCFATFFSSLSCSSVCDAFFGIPWTVCFTLGQSSKQQVAFAKFKKCLAPAFPGVTFVDTAVRDNRSLRVGTTNHSRQKSLSAGWWRLRPRHGHHGRRLSELHELEWVVDKNLIILNKNFL